MIYQIKATLKHTKPPVWRRLQVDSAITFKELHNLLQISFDWYDGHLHCFEILRSRGKSNINNQVEIGPFGNEFMDDPDYDEKVEKLSNWLVCEQDKCNYIYDFGDYWDHEIVLEKVLQAENGVEYPRCVKAMRQSPEEDSGGIQEDMDEIDSKIFCHDINVCFQTLLSDSELEHANE